MLEVGIRAVRLDSRVIVAPVAFQVPPGAILTLMGPSGSGKSTVLHAILGTLAPPLACEGSVSLAGTRLDGLPTHRRGVGLLFQDDLLFPHMSVGQNLLFALPPGPAAARERTMREALAHAQLDGSAGRDPATLSGGQRARVALLRALLAEPRVLLLDEPFSKLDMALRAQMRAFVFDHIRARGIPAVLVTHDPADIAEPERVVRLEAAVEGAGDAR